MLTEVRSVKDNSYTKRYRSLVTNKSPRCKYARKDSKSILSWQLFDISTDLTRAQPSPNTLNTRDPYDGGHSRTGVGTSTLCPKLRFPCSFQPQPHACSEFSEFLWETSVRTSSLPQAISKKGSCERRDSDDGYRFTPTILPAKLMVRIAPWRIDDGDLSMLNYNIGPVPCTPDAGDTPKIGAFDDL